MDPPTAARSHSSARGSSRRWTRAPIRCSSSPTGPTSRRSSASSCATGASSSAARSSRSTTCSRRCWAAAASFGPVASDVQRRLLMARVVGEAPLSVLAPSARFPGFVDALLGLAGELAAVRQPAHPAGDDRPRRDPRPRRAPPRGARRARPDRPARDARAGGRAARVAARGLEREAGACPRLRGHDGRAGPRPARARGAFAGDRVAARTSRAGRPMPRYVRFRRSSRQGRRSMSFRRPSTSTTRRSRAPRADALRRRARAAGA